MDNVRYSSHYKLPDKVKTGGLSQYYSGYGGMFSKMRSKFRPDIITPYLHYLDEKNLGYIVKDYIYSAQNIQAMHNDLVRATGKNIPFSDFEKKVKELYQKKFEDSGISADIFKLYYNKMKDLDFEERTEKNKGKFTVIEKSNDPISKIMTEKSNLKSGIFTRNIMNYLVCKMAFKLIEKPEDEQNMNKGSEDQRDQKFDDMIEQIMQGPGGGGKNDPLLDKMHQQAKDQCLKMDNVLTEEQQEQVFDNFKDMAEALGRAAGSGSVINVMQEYLARINLSMGALKQSIKKLLDRSLSYFSVETKAIYENILDSDNIGGLDEFINLHPKIRNFMIEDVMIKDVERVGRISVYIDVSGSMSSGCGVKDRQGNHVSKLDFCKALAAKLMSMNLLNKIYLFDDHVRDCKTDIFSLAVVGCGGGTSINRVMQHVSQRSDNALILTDAEDHCSYYSEKVFFIGTLGCNFESFQHIAQYSENHQIVEFDGQTIRKIDTEGYPI